MARGVRPEVVFIGDSITERWPVYGDSSWRREWLNRGIGGERSNELRTRFVQDVIALHPRAVVILIGTNDAWANNPALPLTMTEANIAAAATRAHEAGIDVFLASVPAVAREVSHSLPPMPPSAEARIEAQNAWLKDYATRTGSGFIDYWSVMTPALTSDGVHPTASGYERMAGVVTRAISKSLRTPG